MTVASRSPRRITKKMIQGLRDMAVTPDGWIRFKIRVIRVPTAPGRPRRGAIGSELCPDQSEPHERIALIAVLETPGLQTELMLHRNVERIKEASRARG